MSTFTQIKANIAGNLNDSGNINYDPGDLNAATQDAYDEVVALSQCIIKKVTLPFQDNLNYYNFQDEINYPDIFVSDFMACTAIFNNQTNLWLLDDKVLKDFNRDRMDWEDWTGNAIWWAPCNDAKRIAIIPKNLVQVSNFVLYYWAVAPTIVDSDVPLLPPDFESLIEVYATGLLLESYEEFTKAKRYFDDFWGLDESGYPSDNAGIFSLARRAKNIAMSDLLMYA